MMISMIAAMSKNRVIGKNNDIPWRLPDDFQYFKDTTMGHHVIMGRKNWESLPVGNRPLPERTNIVITRQKNYRAEGATVVNSPEKALQLAAGEAEKEVFIIGGGEIYNIGLDLSDRIYLTEIAGTFDGDVTFPEFDREQWREISRNHHPTDKKHQHPFDFVVYSRK